MKKNPYSTNYAWAVMDIFKYFMAGVALGLFTYGVLALASALGGG